MCIYRTQTVLTRQSRSLCSTECIHHGTQSCIIQRTCVTQNKHIMKCIIHTASVAQNTSWNTGIIHRTCVAQNMYIQNTSQNKYITENIFTECVSQTVYIQNTCPIQWHFTECMLPKTIHYSQNKHTAWHVYLSQTNLQNTESLLSMNNIEICLTTA